MITIKKLLKHFCFNIKKNKEVEKMKKVLSFALAAIALVASTAASTGCAWFIFDEPDARNINLD